ncbi:MAG: MalY/PatB family protein [Thermoplasmataceae archaeon]
MSEKRYDFDQVIDRKHSGSVKWDGLKDQFGSEDLLPLWVADMDFRSPQPVIDAMVSRADHGVYGYSLFTPSYYDSVIRWYRRRYNWEIKKEWIVYTPGVVSAISFAIQAFTSPGDKVIVQPPVYYPFFRSIESNGRFVLYNPLRLVDGHYEMDYEDLEDKVRDPRTKLMILCSPHNPVGRVWKKEELERLGNICIDNGIPVVSDEIHSDLRYPGVKFTNFASISDKLANNSITCTSGSKAFNLAGLQISNIIIPNSRMRQIFENSCATQGTLHPNYFAADAIQTAYDQCEDWLDELLEYISGNLSFLKGYVQEKMPWVKVIDPEGTYLCWLDFRAVEPVPTKLEKLMKNTAKVALDDGYIFRIGGDGFQRINLACSRSLLKKALEQISEAVREHVL